MGRATWILRKAAASSVEYLLVCRAIPIGHAFWFATPRTEAHPRLLFKPRSVGTISGDSTSFSSSGAGVVKNFRCRATLLMKCRHCKTKWSLKCGLGPGGAMAPGGYFFFGLGLAGVSALFGYFASWIIAGVACLLSVLLIFMAIGGSGYQSPATAYQGSNCPKCGKRNWIWPWNL